MEDEMPGRTKLQLKSLKNFMLPVTLYRNVRISITYACMVSCIVLCLNLYRFLFAVVAVIDVRVMLLLQFPLCQNIVPKRKNIFFLVCFW